MFMRLIGSFLTLPNCCFNALFETDFLGVYKLEVDLTLRISTFLTPLFLLFAGISHSLD